LIEAFDTIICQWDILHSKLFCVLTDNGSNMVAAFRDQITSKVGVESVDDDDAEQCYINVDPGNSSESDILDEPIEYDSDHDSDAEINGKQAASMDIFIFKQQENEHSLALVLING